MTAETIAAAVWAYSTRTLVSGTPDAPVTATDYIAEAVWDYSTRTLTEEAEEGARPPMLMTFLQ